MNKKTNTVLFLIGGTLFNVIVTVLFSLLFLVAYRIFLYPVLPESSGVWIMPVIFIFSCAASFIVYRLMIKIMTKKFNMEKYLDPIFGGRRPPGKNNQGK
jgi:uncharacterized membrane protein YhdT